MSQQVTDALGVLNEFPDEATPEMIAEALGVAPPRALPAAPPPAQEVPRASAADIATLQGAAKPTAPHLLGVPSEGDLVPPGGVADPATLADPLSAAPRPTPLPSPYVTGFTKAAPPQRLPAPQAAPPAVTAFPTTQTSGPAVSGDQSTALNAFTTSALARGGAQITGGLAGAGEAARQAATELARTGVRLPGVGIVQEPEATAADLLPLPGETKLRKISEALAAKAAVTAPDVAGMSFDQAQAADRLPAWLAYHALVQAPQLAGSIAATLLPPARLATLAVMGASAGGNEYTEAIAAGADPTRSLYDAILSGSAEVAGEYVTFGVFDKLKDTLVALGPAQGAKLLRRVAGSIFAIGATNEVEELVTQGLQNASARVTGVDPTRKITAGMKEVAAIAPIAGVGMAAATAPVALAAGQNAPRLPPPTTNLRPPPVTTPPPPRPAAKTASDLIEQTLESTEQAGNVPRGVSPTPNPTAAPNAVPIYSADGQTITGFREVPERIETAGAPQPSLPPEPQPPAAPAKESTRAEEEYVEPPEEGDGGRVQRQEPPGRPPGRGLRDAPREQVEPEAPEQEAGAVGRSSDEIQKEIDAAEIEAERATGGPLAKTPEIKQLYAERNVAYKRELTESRDALLEVMPKEVTREEATAILRDVYDLDPDAAGAAYFAAEYTERTAGDMRTLGKVYNWLASRRGVLNMATDTLPEFRVVSNASEPLKIVPRLGTASAWDPKLMVAAARVADAVSEKLLGPPTEMGSSFEEALRRGMRPRSTAAEKAPTETQKLPLRAEPTAAGEQGILPGTPGRTFPTEKIAPEVPQAETGYLPEALPEEAPTLPFEAPKARKLKPSVGINHQGTLAQAVRKLGGIKVTENDPLRGEWLSLNREGTGSGNAQLIRVKGKGLGYDNMASALEAAGWVPEGYDPKQLLEDLRDDLGGKPVRSLQYDYETEEEIERLAQEQEDYYERQGAVAGGAQEAKPERVGRDAAKLDGEAFGRLAGKAEEEHYFTGAEEGREALVDRFEAAAPEERQRIVDDLHGFLDAFALEVPQGVETEEAQRGERERGSFRLGRRPEPGDYEHDIGQTGGSESVVEAAKETVATLLGQREAGAPVTTPAWPGDSERRRRLATGGRGKPSIVAHLASYAETVGHAWTRQFISLPETAQFGEALNLLRIHMSAPTVSERDALRILDAITRDFDHSRMELFTAKIALDDLGFDLKEGRPLSFGLTEETYREALEATDAEVAKHPEITAALEARARLHKKLREKLIGAGILSEEARANPAYFHHEVLHYARLIEAKKGAGRRLRTPTPGFARARKGVSPSQALDPEFDINLNYLEAEFAYLYEAMLDLRTVDTLHRLRAEYDETPRLKVEARAVNEAAMREVYERERVAKGFPRGQQREMNDQGEEKGPYISETEAQAMGIAQRFAIGISMLDQTWMGDLSQKKGFELPQVPRRFNDLFEAWRALRETVYEDRANLKEADEDPNGAGLPVPIGHKDFWRFLSWVVQNHGESEASIPAKTIFKASNDKTAFQEQILGTGFSTWETLAAEDDSLALWQPREGMLFYKTFSVPERLIKKLTIEGAEEVGISQADVKAIVAMGGQRPRWAIPAELAETLDDLRPDVQTDDILDSAVTKTLALWKQWVLLNPRRAAKYNLNNLSGDLDAVIFGYPRALGSIREAIEDLYNEAHGKGVSEDYREFADRGGFGAAFSSEVPDIPALHRFRRLKREPDLNAIRALWRATRGATEFRENVLRLAAYKAIKSDRKAGRTIGYLASKKEIVDSLRDPRDRDALQARELLVDYQALSVAGKWIRTRLEPFWSWREGNTKRYWRLIGNTGRDVGIGRAAGLTAYTATKKAALIYTRMFYWYALLMAWNWIFFPDDERKLSERERNELHILLPRSKEGETRRVRLEGSLADLIHFFGFADVVGAFRQMAAGQADWWQAVAALVYAPLNELWQGLRPEVGIAESIVGVSTFPDVARPRSVHDSWRAITQTFSLENEYDAVMHFLFQRPTRGYGESWSQAIWSTRDQNQGAYNDVMDWKARFLRTTFGEQASYSHRSEWSNALRYWKLSIRFGDAESRTHWLAELRSLAARQGIKDEDEFRKRLTKSIESARPLAGLSRQKVKLFYDYLTPAQRERVRLAEEYWRTVYK